MKWRRNSYQENSCVLSGMRKDRDKNQIHILQRLKPVHVTKDIWLGFIKVWDIVGGHPTFK